MAGRGAGGQGHRIRAHHGSSAGGQRRAGRARYRCRSTNAAVMADRRAGRLPQSQRGRAVPQSSAVAAPPASRRTPRGSAGPEREKGGSGPGASVPGGPVPQRGSGVSTCRPPRPERPQAAPGEPDTWRRSRPQGTAWSPALSHYAGLPGPGEGGRAPVGVAHTWPGRGAPPHPSTSNPSFRASGSEGRAGSSGFRRSPPESRPSLTVTRATVGVAAASRTGRG